MTVVPRLVIISNMITGISSGTLLECFHIFGEFLLECFTRHGWCRVKITDYGREFISKVYFILVFKCVVPLYAAAMRYGMK